MTKVHFKQSKDFNHLAQKVYERQEERILRVLWFAEIHHIGSTAIPGSITKGDLDINVRIPLKNFEEAVKKLTDMYQINQPENWTPTFASFKDDDSFELPVGIQITIKDSKYDDFVKLRDLLIDNPNLLEEYNQMKLKYEDRDIDEKRNQSFSKN